MALAWHITCRLASEAVLVENAEERRLLAHTLLGEPGWCQLLAWSCAADHVHLLVQGDRAEAGLAARAAEVKLRRALRPDGAWEGARVRPVDDGRHLQNALIYVLDQHRRHGVGSDPVRESSNLPDLLGLRVLGQWTCPAVRAACPSLRREHLLALYEVPALPDSPALQHLAEAARAVALSADLDGNGPRRVAVRRAAVRLGAEYGAPPDQVRRLLGLEGRLRVRGEVDPAYTEALRRQLSLRAQLPAASLTL